MNRNSEVVFSICSRLCNYDDCKPYTVSEWARLADMLTKAGLQPYSLTELSDSELHDTGLTSDAVQRLRQLMDRRDILASELERYNRMGIFALTLADPEYPRTLRESGRKCPPVLYYSGDIKLADNDCIGFVGSRNIESEDVKFAEKTVSTINSLGYSVVSGGARGVDTVSADASMRNGRSAVVYLADAMTRSLADKKTAHNVESGRLLLLAVTNPDTVFSTPVAMMRNSMIYMHSLGTVVVRSDYKKGGTWEGAAKSLNLGLSPVLCWDNKSYKGNQELIRLGAEPIGYDWNGEIPKEEEFVQLSLFG